MPAKSDGEKAAYLAGLFDGEGYLTIAFSNGNHYRLKLGITNKNLLVLNWVKDFLGGAIYSKTRYKSNHAPTYEFMTSNRGSIIKFLGLVKDLVIVKREQVELGIAFIKLGKIRMDPCNTGHKARAGEQDIRASYKREMSELNKRGL